MEAHRQYLRIREQVTSEYQHGLTFTIRQPPVQGSIDRAPTVEALSRQESFAPGLEKNEEKDDDGDDKNDETSDRQGPKEEQQEDRQQNCMYVDWHSPIDPSNPRNWSNARRAWVFAIIWINVFAVNFAAGAESLPGKVIAEHFHISQEAEALAPTLYTFGISAGALIAGPISETIGRHPIYIYSRLWNILWLFATAVAPNLGLSVSSDFLPEQVEA